MDGYFLFPDLRDANWYRNEPWYDVEQIRSLPPLELQKHFALSLHAEDHRDDDSDGPFLVRAMFSIGKCLLASEVNLYAQRSCWGEGGRYRWDWFYPYAPRRRGIATLMHIGTILRMIDEGYIDSDAHEGFSGEVSAERRKFLEGIGVAVLGEHTALQSIEAAVTFAERKGFRLIQ